MIDECMNIYALTYIKFFKYKRFSLIIKPCPKVKGNIWDPSMQFPTQKKWRGFIAALGEASILANQSGWRDWRACQEAFPAEKKDAKNIQLHAHTKIYNFTQRTSQLHARNDADKSVSQTIAREAKLFEKEGGRGVNCIHK